LSEERDKIEQNVMCGSGSVGSSAVEKKMDEERRNYETLEC